MDGTHKLLRSMLVDKHMSKHSLVCSCRRSQSKRNLVCNYSQNKSSSSVCSYNKSSSSVCSYNKSSSSVCSQNKSSSSDCSCSQSKSRSVCSCKMSLVCSCYMKTLNYESRHLFLKLFPLISPTQSSSKEKLPARKKILTFFIIILWVGRFF